MTEQIEADYVIAGAGAVGMAFADTILAESDATVAIIDNNARPGGHWNYAYPFVRLHQPASTYGVSSKELSSGRKEIGGWNDGYDEMSTGPDIAAYFDDVMRFQFLPTGRVQYFPMCDYHQDGRFVSRVNGTTYQARANKKFVDATHLKTSVPSRHKPSFEIEDGVNFIALNDLVKVSTPPERYIVIGAGKTGVDGCLWLLEHGVDPDQITWVISRDAWFLNRGFIQASEEFFFQTIGGYANQMECIAEAESIEDMFDRLESVGYLMRLDKKHRPTMFRAATMSPEECGQLRRIKDVVRLGRVTNLGLNEVVLEEGRIPTGPDVLHVDCSARAFGDIVPKPIFDGDVITPQLVRPYQPVFSAALTAHVELSYANDAEKNELCGLVPIPNKHTDYLRFSLAALQNQYVWSQNQEIQQWIANNRLDAPSKHISRIKSGDEDKMAVVSRIQKTTPKVVENLMKLVATIQ